MSKGKFKKFLAEAPREELEEQLLDLYNRFKEVKEFYDFSFNPKEDELLNTAKSKTSEEYFPTTRRRAKKRRSIPQNFIKHFIRLGLDDAKILDLMLFQIEIALVYTEENEIKASAFYKSMLKSFRQAISFSLEHLLFEEFRSRLQKIVNKASEQNWENADAFIYSLENLLRED